MNNCVLFNDLVMYQNKKIVFGITTNNAGDFNLLSSGRRSNIAEKVVGLGKAYGFNKHFQIIPQHDPEKICFVDSLKKARQIEITDSMIYFDKLQKRYLGLIHCSHATLSGEILEKSLKMCNEINGKEPSNAHALIFSGICQDCYEVGLDIFENFKCNSDYFGFFEPNKNGKFQLDLAGLIEFKLIESGVKKNNIEIIDICSKHDTFTRTNSEKEEYLLFSYRERNEMERNLIFCRWLDSLTAITGTTGNCPYVIIY